jgi:molybdopterin molybdotransferase
MAGWTMAAHPKAAHLVSFDEAREAVLSAVSALPAEPVVLTEALGRVLAEDIVADADLIPYARSAMDGYALRAADSDAAKLERPVRLPVVGRVLAQAGEASLAPGTALAITTGAPVPRGADAVVPYEQVKRIGDAILLSAPVAMGSSVFPPAEDVRRGELLVRRGEVLRPGTLALVAFIGRTEVRAHRRPRVSVLSTGNELVDVAATPSHGQVRNSNSFTLTALIAESGGEGLFRGIAPDDHVALGEMLRSARRSADLLVTTGGASAGERDLVKDVLAELGADFRFRGVAMRPGKPIGFSTWDGLPVCVLPGNPAAAFVGFYEFVRPALLRLAGRQPTALPTVPATLRRAVKSKPGYGYIILAELELAAEGFAVTPLPNQCSVLVRTAAESNALILLPEGPLTLEAGSTVEVQVLHWDRVLGPAGRVRGSGAADAAATTNLSALRTHR